MGQLLAIAIAGLFFGIVLVYDFNIGMRYKRLFGKNVAKPVKPVDCLPCMVFWCTFICAVASVLMLKFDALIVTFSPMLAYITAIKYDQK